MIETLAALILLNNSRLALDAPLFELAKQRGEYVCEHSFSHDGFEKAAQGVGNHWTHYYFGETLARGKTAESASKTYKAFMKSKKHKKVLIDPAYDKVGIAKADCGVVVVMFAGPREPLMP